MLVSFDFCAKYKANLIYISVLPRVIVLGFENRIDLILSGFSESGFIEFLLKSINCKLLNCQQYIWGLSKNMKSCHLHTKWTYQISVIMAFVFLTQTHTHTHTKVALQQKPQTSWTQIGFVKPTSLNMPEFHSDYPVNQHQHVSSLTPLINWIY